MKKLLFINLLLILSINAFAQQSDKEAITKAVNTMFDAMRKGDSTLLKSVFAKGVVFQGVANKKDGSVALETDDPNDFAKAVGTPHKEIWDERITITDIKIDGDLASVWAPYKFYLGGKFSHCGVDVFQLMKTKDGWKIIYTVDTRRKDNCPE